MNGKKHNPKIHHEQNFIHEIQVININNLIIN